jgi:nitroreductase
MINFFKKLLPNSFKERIFDLVNYLQIAIINLFKHSSILSSLYYLFFSRMFDREHKAFLQSKIAYRKYFLNAGVSSPILRRNIHRLEKGLIMRPRKDLFGEKYIIETVDIYNHAVESGKLNRNEKKWAEDVLNQFFKIVKDSKIISQARDLFEKSINTSQDNLKFVPYSFDKLPKTNIDYYDLNKLFLKRRSVRWYTSQEVPIELLNKAVDIASSAPSACNRQPYSFYVSKTKEMAVDIAKLAGGTNGWAENIPCTIVVVGDLSAYSSEKDRHIIYIDSSLAAMQLLLTLETLGLSSCMINWADQESAEIKMSKLLDLKPYQRPIMLISVGYANPNGGIPYSQKKKSENLIKQV